MIEAMKHWYSTDTVILTLLWSCSTGRMTCNLSKSPWRIWGGSSRYATLIKYWNTTRYWGHSIIFTQVDPSEAWLQDECDGTAYFLQEGGQFNLHSPALAPYATLIVEGPEITASMPPPRTSNLPPPRPLTVSSTNHLFMLPPPTHFLLCDSFWRSSFSLASFPGPKRRKGLVSAVRACAYPHTIDKLPYTCDANIDKSQKSFLNENKHM